jgi:hypothetical protein
VGKVVPETQGDRPIRPRRLWYWVAGALLAIAAACVALGIAAFFGLDQQVQDFQRVQVPGGAVVTFTQRGGYVLYVEEPGSCCSFSVGSGGSDGNGDSSGPPFPSWSMRVALEPVAGGQLVPIRTWQGATESYAVSGHQGQTAMSFTISRPGQYRLVASSVTPSSIADLAAGHGLGQGVTAGVLLVLAGLAALAAGLVVGVITVVRRRRARRNLQAASFAPAAAPWPGGWQPAPPPPAGPPYPAPSPPPDEAGPG